MKSMFCVIILSLFHLFSHAETRSIGIFLRYDFKGEREYAERMRIACENLNWELKIYNILHLGKVDKNLDWYLTLTPSKNYVQDGSSHLVIFDPEHHYFDENGYLKYKFLKFSGYLTTFPYTEPILEYSNRKNKSLYPKRWYPTAQHREYKKLTPRSLFFFLGQWGIRRFDARYIILQDKLAEMPYTRFYGNPDYGKEYGEAYQGMIPFDGESALDRIAENGVCLVLHSGIHLRHGIPSGRIFEAASASAVIISDLNQFVIDNFGDSVLYVDHNLSGEEMFAQIDSHMRWILANPEEAMDLAAKSHQIFEEKFMLENQLLDFDAFIQSEMR